MTLTIKLYLPKGGSGMPLGTVSKEGRRLGVKFLGSRDAASKPSMVTLGRVEGIDVLVPVDETK